MYAQLLEFLRVSLSALDPKFFRSSAQIRERFQSRTRLARRLRRRRVRAAVPVLLLLLLLLQTAIHHLSILTPVGIPRHCRVDVRTVEEL